MPRKINPIRFMHIVFSHVIFSKNRYPDFLPIKYSRKIGCRASCRFFSAIAVKKQLHHSGYVQDKAGRKKLLL